ncbi:MAG: DUF1656 domain-containing protein [Bilophila wadsworthia]
MLHELALVGIYFSPLLPIVLLGILGAGDGVCVEPYRLSGWFANPPWVFMALIVIYVCLLLPFGMVL